MSWFVRPCLASSREDADGPAKPGRDDEGETRL